MSSKFLFFFDDKNFQIQLFIHFITIEKGFVFEKKKAFLLIEFKIKLTYQTSSDGRNQGFVVFIYYFPNLLKIGCLFWSFGLKTKIYCFINYFMSYAKIICLYVL